MCFAAGTLVHTENGLRPIEEVKKGDLVWSRDEATGEIALRREREPLFEWATTALLKLRPTCIRLLVIRWYGIRRKSSPVPVVTA